MQSIVELINKVRAFNQEALKILGVKESITSPIVRQQLSFDIAVLTATPAEFKSVISMLSDIKEFEIGELDATIYHSGILKDKNKSFKVLVPYPTGMGSTITSSITTKIMTIFAPRYIFMIGIAAGNKNINNVGDILIAEKSINYEEVVEIEKKNKTTLKKFMQNADSINTYFKTKLTKFSTSSSIQEIQNGYKNKKKIESELKCKIGLIVTGSSIIRSQSKIEELNKTYHNIIGLDMETHGLYYVASNTLKTGAPYFVSIKSVSDFGDSSQHSLSLNERRDYALYTSSETFKKFVLNYL